MSYFITGAHGNTALAENQPVETDEALPRGNGLNVVGRPDSTTWITGPIQVPKIGDKLLDVNVVASLGSHTKLIRLDVWIGGRNMVFTADKLDITGQVDRTFVITGEPELTAGITISLLFEFGSSENYQDRLVVIHSFDSQMKTDTLDISDISMKKVRRDSN